VSQAAACGYTNAHDYLVGMACGASQAEMHARRAARGWDAWVFDPSRLTTAPPATPSVDDAAGEEEEAQEEEEEEEELPPGFVRPSGGAAARAGRAGRAGRAAAAAAPAAAAPARRGGARAAPAPVPPPVPPPAAKRAPAAKPASTADKKGKGKASAAAAAAAAAEEEEEEEEEEGPAAPAGIAERSWRRVSAVFQSVRQTAEAAGKAVRGAKRRAQAPPEPEALAPRAKSLRRSAR
jgi:hypothetical protein